MGRSLAGALCVYHITGVAIWLLPDKDSLGGEGKSSWRLRAQDPFKWWIRMSRDQPGLERRSPPTRRATT